MERTNTRVFSQGIYLKHNLFAQSHHSRTQLVNGVLKLKCLQPLPHVASYN